VIGGRKVRISLCSEDPPSSGHRHSGAVTAEEAADKNLHKVLTVSADVAGIGYTLCMSSGLEHVSRSLSGRESQVMAWLEEERPAVITAADLVAKVDVPPTRASDVLRRMAAKGWLHRVAQGSYEPLLAESGGVALPNPWATLSAWSVSYYVSYGSAAYELGLTPDRPGAVHVCVAFGTTTPARFTQLPLTLVAQRHFSLAGSATRPTHGFEVRMAGIERLLIDCAIRPSRVGGVIALGRILYRSLENVQWAELVSLAHEHPRGRAGARRLAALLDVIEQPVPKPLAVFASEELPKRPMLLDDASIYGWRGPTFMRWAVVVNVPVEALREELHR
jgi:predicted transcriptional regulator of viral defense system